MEKNNNQRVADQREVIRDLQQKLSQSQDENEKKSLQLKINVAQAKLEELENEQANDISTNSPVNEETPQNTKQFHNAITDGEYSDKLDESMPQGYSKSQFLKKDIPEAIKVIERELSFAKQHMKDERSAFALLRGDFEAIEHFAEMVKSNCKELGNYETKGMLSEAQDEDYIIKQVCLYAKPQMFKSKGVTPAMLATAIGDYIVTTPNSSDIFNVNHFAKILDKVIASRKENPNKHILQKVEKNCSKLFEGCMTKKFENMTNREIASYIFSHPHTKFASKMKECDDKEIMKAILDMKKASEDAPVTNTSAVANPQGANSMYMKRPEPEELKDDYLK